MKMREYVIKRLLLVIPVLLGVSFIMFFLIYRLPGDPADYLLALEDRNVNPEIILRIKEIYGLDKPIYYQYYLFLRRLIAGNLGRSFTSGRQVGQEILARTPNTLALQVAAFALSVAIAVPAGITCAIKQNTKTDTYVMMGALFGASVPTFFLGLLMIYGFALILGWFPTTGAHSTEFFGDGIPHGLQYWIDYLWHMTLPAVTLAVATTGYTARLVRSSMLSVLREDYVMAARSKGLKERTVIYKHALKNAMLPVITLLGLRIGVMLSGAPIIEQVFSWPGLGKYFVLAVKFRDYSVAVGAAIVLGIMIVIANLLIDISYRWLDPRVEL
jgi:peptide/nickel transport system permease protein